MDEELRTTIRDAIFMFKDIEKARQLPAYANVQAITLDEEEKEDARHFRYVHNQSR